MYKLTFFVPDSHVELVKNAIFDAGGGNIGNYSHCCWQILGQGQFKSEEGSNPYSGTINELTNVEEWRVELVVHEDNIRHAVDALKVAHPYETPAYNVIRLEQF